MDEHTFHKKWKLVKDSQIIQDHMFHALSYQRKGRVDVRKPGAHRSHPRLADNDLAIVRLHVLVHVFLQLRRDGGAGRDEVLADLWRAGKRWIQTYANQGGGG